MVKASLMESKTEEFIAELVTYDIQKHRLRNFELYEEYSRKTIADTIRICKENYDKADSKAKRELVTKVESQIESFRAWLENTKKLHPTTAHYYSICLKSLLLGLPIGVPVARLFDIILEIYTK